MDEMPEAKLVSMDKTLIVKCPEEFDSVAVSAIRAAIVQAIDESTQDIVFDFSATEFIDSSGIGICVFCFKKHTPKGHRVGIAALKGQPKSIIDLSQIDKSVPVFASVESFIADSA